MNINIVQRTQTIALNFQLPTSPGAGGRRQNTPCPCTVPHRTLRIRTTSGSGCHCWWTFPSASTGRSSAALAWSWSWWASGSRASVGLVVGAGPVAEGVELTARGLCRSGHLKSRHKGEDLVSAWRVKPHVARTVIMQRSYEVSYTQSYVSLSARTCF